MKRPKISIPKLSLTCGLSVLAASVSLVSAPAGIDPIMAGTITMGLGGLANLSNAFAGRFASEADQIFEKFSQIENEDLEKCSLDAVLEALILVAREVPNHPEAQKNPYNHQAYQIHEFVEQHLEQTLQYWLEQLIKNDKIPAQIANTPTQTGNSRHFQTILGDVQTKTKTDPKLIPLPDEVSYNQLASDQTDDDIRVVLTNYALSLFPLSVRRLHYFSWFEQMLRDGFNWQDVPCHWFDLYCHCLMGNLKQDTPEYCNRAHKILLEKGVASLLLEQQKQTVKIDQLIAWAIEQQKQYDHLVQLLTEFAKPRPPQPHLRVLELSNSNENNNHYRKRLVNMVGRDETLAELDAFLQKEDLFSWWAVTGPGGMGKSRLALETCLRHGYPHDDKLPDWEAGFIFDDDALQNANGFDWLTWRPIRPHLIVIDYVVGRETAVKTMLGRLCGQRSLTKPVRVLLLERNAEQQWWQDLVYDANLNKAQHQAPLVLTAPDDDNLWHIVQQIYQQHGKQLAEEGRLQTMEAIARIDPVGRPLFVMFIALAMARGDFSRDWTRDELLRYHLRHDEQLWRKGIDPALLRKHKNLLALTTIAGGLSKTYLINILREKWEFLPSLSELTMGRDLYNRMAAINSTGDYAPLEPDPYGEFFVLEWLRQANDDLLIDMAADAFAIWTWANKPDKISAFTFRTFQTYASKGKLPLLDKLYSLHFLDNCTEDTAKHRAELVMSFTYLLQEVPAISFELVEDIKRTKSILQYPSSRLALAKSVTNLIRGLRYANSEEWRQRVVTELDWLKKWVIDETDTDLQVELSKSITNFVWGLNRTNSDEWRKRAVAELEWLKKWLEDKSNASLQLEITKSAMNLIGALSRTDSDEWRQRAIDEFEWLKAWSIDENTALHLALVKSTTNLIGGLAQANGDRWRQRAIDEFERLKKWLNDEADPDLRLELAKSASGLIGGLAQVNSDEWRQRAVDEFEWLKAWLANEADPAINLMLATSATNLIGGLAQANGDRWRQRAVTEFGWFEAFTVRMNQDDIFIMFVRSAYYIILVITRIIQSPYGAMSTGARVANWVAIEYHYGRILTACNRKSLSADLLYHISICLEMTLENPKWVHALFSSALPVEQAQEQRTEFWERVIDLNNCFGLFQREERWQQLKKRIKSKQVIMNLIKEYSKVMNTEWPNNF